MEIKIPYKPRPYQLEIHNDPHRFKIIIFHRQAGKTTLAVNELIKRAVLEPGVYLYVGPEKSQAKNIIWKDPTVLFHYVPNELVKKKNEVELTLYFKKTQKDCPAAVFYIEGAGTAEQLQKLRGIKPRGIIFDEFDQMPMAVWTEILFAPINQNGGWVIFIGTFKGQGNLYYLLTQLRDPATGLITPLWNFETGTPYDHPDYRVWILPYHKNQFFTEDQIRAAKTTMPPAQFDQEYGCIPMMGSSSVFPSLKDLMTGALEEPTNHYYSMGIDLAKYQDYTAVSIIDKNTNHLVYQERWQGEWSTTLEKIIRLRNRYNKAAVTIDSTGVGDPIAEMLAKRGVKCTDFKFSNTSKDQLVRKMGIFFSEKKLVLPPINQIPNLVNELEQFAYEILASGKIRYSAPTGCHDDEVMSLGLAVWPLKDQLETNLYTISVPNQSVPELDPY